MLKISLKSCFAIIAAVMILTIPLIGPLERTLQPLIGAPEAMADTANPSPASSGYMVMPMPIMGLYTSNTASVVKFKVPYPAKLVHVSATARQSSGSNPTLTVNVKDAGTTVLSSPISITAGTVTDGVISSPTVTDESLLSVDFAITGTAPRWNDITLLLLLKRL